MPEIVFLDTETLGLHPDAPIWEFAASRRLGPADYEVHFTIQHDPAGWLNDMPEQFLADYHARYDETTAWCERAAAREIAAITRDAIIAGSNPGFDIERLTKLLGRHGITPTWHYHPLDVPTLVQGYLAARGELPEPPWKSDGLSAALGVDPAAFDRHTAMGDVRWVRAQYETVMRNG
ncbi:hypothetical protein [Mycobacterium malmoense]|uniref:hypothetical protein n=1 Tax=Mycobacterium malmoense TaxID=1780 RepID=UPI0008F8ACDD|nr:hypothetical protein [Mycobacterium malmoense]OIN80748.1 hypothetical protein BMG05_10385 [Mycobacterium malmoense]